MPLTTIESTDFGGGSGSVSAHVQDTQSAPGQRSSVVLACFLTSGEPGAGGQGLAVVRLFWRRHLSPSQDGRSRSWRWS